jgi:hypothetical protein
MAVPTISAVTPNVGHTGGRTLLEITGTGFAMTPTAPPNPGGRLPDPPPSMIITVGGAPATAVAVASSTQIFCQTPIHDVGTFDVVVQNCDATGAPIVGETATAAAAYTFERPNLAKEGQLMRVLKQFLIELNRQIVDNVCWAVHTDYDKSTGDRMNIAFTGKLPSIVLSNLRLPENRTQAQSAPIEVQLDATTFVERRPPDVRDALFRLSGIANTKQEAVNLFQAVVMFFKKNPVLTMFRSADDPTQGTVEYEMHATVGGTFSVTRQADNTNVFSFTGDVAIDAIWIEDMPGVSEAKVNGVPSWMPHEATIRYGWIADTVTVRPDKLTEP